MNNDYHLGLLCLTHLLVCADGVVAASETDALKIIKEKEDIKTDVIEKFEAIVQHQRQRDIYQTGIHCLNNCSDAEKLKVFVTLYKLSEVDGRVHLNEIRLLLYSIKLAGVEFDDVVNLAMASPPII